MAMKTIAMTAAAAVLVAGAALGTGSAHADADEICGPAKCLNHLEQVCSMIKNDYYSHKMVIDGTMRATELRASARPMVESIIDDVIDANCPEVRRLSYF
jgi:hypothetical protein